MSTTVRVTEREDGNYTAVDTGTGAFGEGRTAADALAQLAEKLRHFDPEEEWRELTADIKERFEENDVTEADVEDAIEWARLR